MHRVLLAVLLFLTGALSARAQTLTLEQKSKLLEILPPPSVSFQFRVGISSDGYYLSTEEQDKAVRVGRLLLKKTPNEPRARAAHLVELAKALYSAGESEKGAKQAAEAEQIYRTLLEAKDVPDRLALELERAEALDYQQKTDEAQALYRDLVKRYPDAWQSWLGLAGYLEEGAYRIAAESAAPGSRDFSRIIQSLTTHKLPIEIAQNIRTLLSQSEAALLRARALGPKEAQIPETTLALRSFRWVTQGALDNTEGKTVDWSALYTKDVLSQGYLALSEEVAALRPNAPLPLLHTTFIQLTMALQESKENDNRRLGERLPAAVKERLRAAITQLTKIGGDVALPAEERGRAWEGAASLVYAFQEDKEAAERFFRESRQVAPERSGGWLGGIAALTELQRYNEAFQLAEEYKRRRATPEGRLMYAITAVRAGRLREAESEFRTLKEETPSMLLAYVGIATVLAKRSATEPDRLQEALDAFNAIGEKFNQEFGQHQVSVYLIAGVLYALADQVKTGIEYLEWVEKASPGSETVTKILEILRAAR